MFSERLLCPEVRARQCRLAAFMFETAVRQVMILSTYFSQNIDTVRLFFWHSLLYKK